MPSISLGDTLKGVVLCTAAQAGVAGTMAKGSAKACSLVLVVLNKEGADRIPGKIDGQRRFMKGTITDASSKGAKTPQIHRGPQEGDNGALRAASSHLCGDLWNKQGHDGVGCEIPASPR